MYSLLENFKEKMLQIFINFSLLSGAMRTMTANIKILQNVILLNRRNFDMVDIKCVAVLQRKKKSIPVKRLLYVDDDCKT